jgi:hypothetical protein
VDNTNTNPRGPTNHARNWNSNLRFDPLFPINDMNKHQKHLPLTWACAAAAATVRHLERVRFQLLLVSILSWQCIPDIYGQTFTNLQLSGHSDAVNSVAFSPDGKTLLTGSADHTARLWDASTGKATRILSQHTEAVNAAVFSHSGNSILTGSSDGKLGFWSGTGDFKTTADFGLGIYSVAISPDGTRFMVGTGTLLLVLPPRPSVYVYDAQQGGQPLLVLGPESLDAFYTSVAYSPTEAKILTGMAGVLFGGAKLWDAKSGKELFELGLLDRVNSVAFSPDGAKALTASGNAAHLWDVATGMAIRDLTGHTAEVKSAAFSPDGKKVLTGSSDKTARLWDAATGELLRTFTGHSDTVNAVAFSPDGTQILTGSSDKTALLWATPSLPAPTITSVSPNPVTGSDSPQPFTISGNNFVSGCNVVLRDVTAVQTFAGQAISSFSGTAIIINPNFTTAAHNWSVEVISPGGASSGQFNFSVVAPSCQLSFAHSFKQGGPTPDVPVYFGYDSTSKTGDCSDPATGRAKTSCYGCVLSSLATMLTSFKGLESTTPATLDVQLKNVNGYVNRADMDWCKIDNATGHAIGLVDSGAHSDADIDAYLNDHFCGHGDSVILEMNESVSGKTGKHFILVTGKANADWTVFDPGWQNPSPAQNLLTLSGHRSGFTPTGKPFRTFSVAGVRTYREGSISTGKFCVKAHSPIELLVTDPSGRRVGWDGTNDMIEIPGASYFRDYPIVSADDPTAPDEGDPNGSKTVLIPSPAGGVYQVVATGTGAGAYSLDLETVWPGSGGHSATYSGTATAGATFTNTFFVIVPPLITGIAKTANGLAFSFATQTNATYFVDSKTSLADASWTPLQTVAGTGGIVTVNTTNSASTQFYHVKAQ